MRSIYKNALFIAILVISLNVGLLAYAYLSAGREYVFAGILYNPLDGNSYLAKIQQGVFGSWRFTLPYVCESGKGAYVFLYYLFLGHLSRWLGVSSIFIFHFARLINSILLAFMMAVFIQKIIPDQDWARHSLWLASLGSGMGWLLLPLGIMTADMWLAEAYPFLSMVANPHFPLGLAITLGIIYLALDRDCWRNAILAGILSLLLAIVQPFLIVTTLLVVLLITINRLVTLKELQVKCFLLVVFCGLPYLVYQFWALNTDPILAQWTAQNQTPAPALWDLVLSLSPVILFAMIALIRYKKVNSENRLMIALWLLVTLIITYVPFALQRRFLAGVYIPGVILAVLGILTFANRPRLTLLLNRIALSLSLPGTALILIVLLFGVNSHSSALYLSQAEAGGIAWLKENSARGSLVLASPEIGAFLPARSGNCVIYGHPFETIDQKTNQDLVLSIYDGSLSTAQMDETLRSKGVDYIFVGPRERNLGPVEYFESLPVVYSSGDVIVYQIPPD